MDKLIIGVNKTLVDIAKQGIEILADNLNRHLEAWPEQLPKPKLSDFAANPKQCYEAALVNHAKLKGMEGVVISEYAKMFGISFFPDLQHYPIELKYMEFVKVVKGKVVPVPDYEEKVKDFGTVTVTDPKQIEAAKLLLDTFRKFTYLATLNAGAQMPQLAGMEKIGFSLYNAGNLSADTVARIADAMANAPIEDFEKRLVEQFHNPTLAA